LKIAFAGAGAVGCHYGSRLQQAGSELLFLARGAHLATLQQHGLLHESEGVTQRLQISATDDPIALCSADVLIFSSKMTGLQPLIDRFRDKVNTDTLLVTMQNGVEAPQWLQQAFPHHAIAAATAFIGARLEAPGYLVHSAAGGIRLGLWQAGQAEGLLPELVEQFKAAQVPCRLEADVAAMLWRKLLWNTGFNAITAIHRRFARQMCEDEKMLAIVRSAMEETVNVAQAEGINIGEADIEAHIDVTMKMGPVKTSMWQDIEAGHKSEVAYINGAVVRVGEKLGMAVPVNRMLWQQIQDIESNLCIK